MYGGTFIFMNNILRMYVGLIYKAGDAGGQ